MTAWGFLLGLLPACISSGDVLDLAHGGRGGASGSPGGSGGNSAGESCGEVASGQQWQPCAAGYLGSPGDDEMVAAVFTAEGKFLLAGNFGESFAAEPDDSRLSDGPGHLLWLSPEGALLEAPVTLGVEIRQIGWDSDNGRVIVATANELISYDRTLANELWRQPLDGAPERIAVGESGGIAVLDERARVSLFTDRGQIEAAFDVDAALASDVALSDDLGLAFVTGARSDVVDCEGNVPFLRAYDNTGNVVWRAWDFADPQGQCASSRGRRLHLGADGYLYYAGENQGGNTVHVRDPLDVTEEAPLVSFDLFNQGYGKAIERYGFVARFDPQSGEMLLGTRILPREDEVGGSFLIEALAADDQGRLAIAAQTTCCIAERSSARVAGEAVGAFGEAEASLLRLSADFQTREAWLVFTKDSRAVTRLNSLAWSGSTLLAVGSSLAESELITHEALHSSPIGGADGYFAVGKF